MLERDKVEKECRHGHRSRGSSKTPSLELSNWNEVGGKCTKMRGKGGYGIRAR